MSVKKEVSDIVILACGARTARADIARKGRADSIEGRKLVVPFV